MRFFGLSALATLAFAIFSSAAPTPAGVPVNAIAARHEGGHTKENSLEVVLVAAVDLIIPITTELGCLKPHNATLEVIAPLVVDLKAAIGTIIVEVEALASLPLDRILCTVVEGVLSALDIAKLLACLFNLIFGACAYVLLVVNITIRVQICALLAEVGCLVGSLLCAVLALVTDLVAEIIVCLLPQIAGCINIILTLKIDVLIKVLHLGL